jgi:hypothetical protein
MNLLFLLLIPNIIYKNNNINTLCSELDIHKNIHLGYDERYVKHDTNDTSNNYLKRETEDMEQIARYMNVLEKINKLQNADIFEPDIHDETLRNILRDEIVLRDEIGYMDIGPYNIKAGGLLSDW